MRETLSTLLAMALGLRYRCPHCRVKSGRRHRPGCRTGAWDGGVWG